MQHWFSYDLFRKSQDFVLSDFLNVCTKDLYTIELTRKNVYHRPFKDIARVNRLKIVVEPVYAISNKSYVPLFSRNTYNSTGMSSLSQYSSETHIFVDNPTSYRVHIRNINLADKIPAYYFGSAEVQIVNSNKSIVKDFGNFSFLSFVDKTKGIAYDYDNAFWATDNLEEAQFICKKLNAHIFETIYKYIVENIKGNFCTYTDPERCKFCLVENCCKRMFWHIIFAKHNEDDSIYRRASLLIDKEFIQYFPLGQPVKHF